MMYSLCLLLAFCWPSSALAQSFTARNPQYLFLNRAPGRGYHQNQPDTITDRLFTEPLEAIGTRGATTRKLGLSFIFSYLDGPPDPMEATLRRLLALAEKHETPILIVLDGENWWGYRSDLWNWWDDRQPGYDPKNAENVEWTDWGAERAVKIGWRNWGRQIRVLPQPNLAAPRFREASRKELTRLVRVLKRWADDLPPEKRYLFPGVKIGWEASIGINAYYYPDGNRFLEHYPNDVAHDPQTGLDMKKDFAGGAAPLGYAALTSKGWKHPGPITKADQERIVTDYLSFLAGVCHRAGLPREKVFTHAGGQYAPYEKHTSHRIAINRDSLPGWSLYGTQPEDAGDLAASLTHAHLSDWAAAEWLPHASTAEQWRDACNRTLGFRRCHFLSLYNWEGIRNNAPALEGIRQALQ
jgi:hypothetical protein